jgi:hypothetical protein
MRILSLILLIVIFYSCNDEIPNVLVPDWKSEGYLDNTDPVPNEVLALLNGIFKFGKGSANFGEKAVFKWNHAGLSVFTGKDATYMILQSGVRDSVLLFSGYWRSATGSETGLVSFRIDKDD